MVDMAKSPAETPKVYPHQLSPETLTPEEEVGYVVESARIHFERGALDAMGMREWIVGGLPDGYRIGGDGEIVADDPALPAVPNLGETAPLPR